MSNPPTKKLKCWAASCGNCSAISSREHLVSECLFPEGVVQVAGFDWCGGETKTIGIAGLVRKILCKTHNELLAPTDAEAKKAVNLFQRTTPPTEEDPLGDNLVNGGLLERWLLKTAINVSIGGGLHIGVGMTESVPGLPAPYLVDVAFAKIPFLSGMGAYFIIPECETLHSPGEIVIIPLVKDGHIGGFFFELRSQTIFLNLHPGGAPDTLGSAAPGLGIQQALLDAQLYYRPVHIATVGNGRPVSSIRFSWPAAGPFPSSTAAHLVSKAG